MSDKKYLFRILFGISLSFAFLSSAYALPGFVVDGSNAANSTGPCVGKTVCQISGDLVYSDITLQNGGVLWHRGGTLTVSNNFVIGTGATASGVFVGQNLSVGNQLLVRGPSILALNNNLTADSASNDPAAWMGSNYYDLAVTNTNTAYDGLDISLSSGGYVKTRNTVVNSRFKLSASSTNVYWNTYAGGYVSIDGDANITDIKMDIDGYLFVQGNLNHSLSSSYYLTVRGVSQVLTPGAADFTSAGIRVDGNLTFTGNTSNYPQLSMSGATGSAGDNIYASGTVTISSMLLGSTSTGNILSLGNIESKNSSVSLSSVTGAYLNGNIRASGNITLLTVPDLALTDIISSAGNISLTSLTNLVLRDTQSVLGTISFSGITTGAGRDLNAKQGVTVANFTSYTARNLTNSGAFSFSNIGILTSSAIVSSGSGTFSAITTFNRLGNITTASDVTFSNVTTSSWSATNVTSTAGKIIIGTGTTHTYNNLSSYSDQTINAVTSYKANNIASNQRLVVTASTIETTNTTDQDNEWTPNLDITTGGDFIITNSTGNLRRSSIQVNGWLEINNTLWTSQNLNINGYQTIGSDKVGIYFRGGRDRYVYGNIFAGGGSIWVGTSGTPDNGNILLFRNAQVVTNGWIKMYRDTASNVDRFSFLPNATITENSGIFSQLYNGAAAANSGSVTATGNIVTNPSKLIDSDSNGQLVVTTGLDAFATAVFWTAVFGWVSQTVVWGATVPGSFGGSAFGSTTFWSFASDFYALNQTNSSFFWQSLFWGAVFSGTTGPIGTAAEFTLARDMTLSKVCVSATENSPSDISMQFKDALGTVTNTQSLKVQSMAIGRNCFDINATKARKVTVTGYPETVLGFKEFELWGIPTDIANIAVSLNDDVTLSNGSYELWGNISAKNLAITSTSGKKARVVQYSSNGVFDAKSSINLTNTTAGNTLLTHSVGNELGLKFVTDTMTVGTGVLLDVSAKGYAGWNANSTLTTTAGGTGNISPGAVKMSAWDGSVYGWVGGYGVSGGGWGGTGLGTGTGELYTFSSHTFTTCWTSWQYWPSLSSCRSSYSTAWDENSNYFDQAHAQWIQLWTVPKTWLYTIKAYGAKWWNSNNWWTTWWYWAIMQWDVKLYRGQKIKILVGQMWSNDTYDGWGGWGTFVTKENNEPLIIAAWGGWSSASWFNGPGKKAWSTQANWFSTTSWPGWTNGMWGGWSTAGGGWWLLWDWYGSWRWRSFLNWWAWWSNGSYYWWFGWGWGGGWTNGAWGGWWYSGWWYSPWSYEGAWWWSYNIWSSQINQEWANGSNWQVDIAYKSSISLIEEYEAIVGNIKDYPSVSWAGGWNLGYGGYGGSATCTGSVGNNTLGNTKGGNGGGVAGGSGTNWHGGGGSSGCSGGGGGTGWNSDMNPYRLGSGWGAGALVTDNFTTGYGGNGGGMIRISSNTLNINGTLLANGQAGKKYMTSGNWVMIYSAGWGGAGGSILIRAKALTCNAGNSIEVKGGTGGSGSSANYGGGWGGGGVITYYYTNKTGTCAWVATKGSAGNSGWWADGQDGLIYESIGTTFDTLKSRVTIENSPAQADGVQAVTVRAYFLDVNGVPLEGEYLVASVVGDIGTGKINAGNPLPQTDANGMLSFPVTSTVKGIKKIVLKNAITYTEIQEQPTFTFGIPQISIAKTANKSTVNSGDVVTYTITLTNSGSGDAWGDVENAIVIEDVLPTGFIYYTAGPTAGTKWDYGSGTTQYYLFPETSGDGTSWNEQRLKYTIADGMSGPPKIAAGTGVVRIIFDSKAP